MAEKINYKEVFFNPFSKNNPVVVQVLGICSVLAVTAKLEPALVMGLSVILSPSFLICFTFMGNLSCWGRS